jgi:hypothetical protein
MKNLTKLTKAELISKLKVNNNNKNNNPTFFSKTLEYILLFKGFILKFTLLAIIFKFFKKYSIIRRIMTVVNTILFSIFGFSLIDIYEIEFLSKFFRNIADIFSNFYTNILELFGKKANVPINTATKMESLNGINPSSTGYQTGINESNSIIERFSKIIHNQQPIQPEIIEDTPFYKDRDNYIKAAAILLLLGLGYYYWDDISPIGTSIFAWINRFRSRPDPDADGNNANLSWTSRFDLSKLKDSVKNKFYDKPKDDQDNGSNSSDSHIGLSSPNDGFRELLNNKDKAIDKTNLSEAEILRRSKLDQILDASLKPELTGMTFVKGENFEYIKEANALMKEIKAFNLISETSPRLKEQVSQDIYLRLQERISNLYENNPEVYRDMIRNRTLNDSLDLFIRNKWKVLDYPIIPSDKNNYEELEVASRNEQDVWSDKAPSAPLSPTFLGQTVMDSIEQDKPKSPLDLYWDRLKNRNNIEEGGIIGTIKSVFKEVISDDTEITGPEILPEARADILEALNNSSNEMIQTNDPNNTGSSDSQMLH